MCFTYQGQFVYFFCVFGVFSSVCFEYKRLAGKTRRRNDLNSHSHTCSLRNYVRILLLFGVIHDHDDDEFLHV